MCRQKCQSEDLKQQEFKVGDTVKFGDDVGTVVRNYYSNGVGVGVKFPGDVVVSFHPDGLYRKGMKTKLVKIKPPTKKITGWVVAKSTPGAGSCVACVSNLYESKEKAEATHLDGTAQQVTLEVPNDE